MSKILVRLATAVSAAAFVALLAAGPAYAGTVPPEPENPISNGSLSGVLSKPSVLPDPADPWAPGSRTSILEQYGTAGPTFHFYELNALEEVGASMWAEVSNTSMDTPKLAIAAAVSLAGWVLNPAGWTDQFGASTDAAAKELYSTFASPLLLPALAAAAIAAAWAAARGKIGKVATRAVFTVVSLILVGTAFMGPSVVTGSISRWLLDTVSGVLAPSVPGTGPDLVQSDADANHMSAQTKANAGARILAPIWKAGIYDPWVEGTLGSSTTATAQKYGPRLFKAQALTWVEADRLETMPTDSQEQRDAKTAATKTLLDAKRNDWTSAATEIDKTDPAAYRFLQGSEGAGVGTVVWAWVVVAACLWFIIAALVMALAGAAALYVLGALLPVIGVACLLNHDWFKRVMLMFGAAAVSMLVFATAARVMTVFAGQLLAGPNKLFGVVAVMAISILLWKFLKSFRNPVSTKTVSPTQAVSESVTSVTKVAAKVAGTVKDRATAPYGEPVVDADGQPWGKAGARGEAEPNGARHKKPATEATVSGNVNGDISGQLTEHEGEQPAGIRNGFVTNATLTAAPKYHHAGQPFDPTAVEATDNLGEIQQRSAVDSPEPGRRVTPATRTVFDPATERTRDLDDQPAEGVVA